MPNWCENELRISGEREYVIEFLKDAGYFNKDGSTFSFNGLRPMPDTLRKIHTGSTFVDGVQYGRWYEDELKNVVPITEKEAQSLCDMFGACDWYDWANKYWGTKWDASNVDYMSVDLEDPWAYAELRFETAWGPPEYLYDYLLNKYPNVELDWFYKEPAMRFAGWLGVD